MTTYFDHRWIGPHGIGRFAQEVANHTRFQAIGLTGKPLALQDPWRLRRTLKTTHPAHFFSPGFNAPLGRPCDFSFTIHDLIHLEFPAEQSLPKQLYYHWVIRPATHNASVVFTVSEYSRRRIIEWSGVDDNKVVVCGNGVDARFFEVGPGWQHPRPYLLYVGNQKPHKNVEALISAYAKSRVAPDVDLLLTGQFSAGVAQVVNEQRLGGKVVALGSVPEQDLPALYRGAQALVMPSLHEGFGLPVVEAMAAGTPVLSSNRTSLPEVGGDAVLYFEPDRLDSIVETLNQTSDSALMQQLRLAGPIRAAQFRWSDVAQRITAAIANPRRA
jgi:glycosyltransferase involved in cell wall biosynthesis